LTDPKNKKNERTLFCRKKWKVGPESGERHKRRRDGKKAKQQRKREGGRKNLWNSKGKGARGTSKIDVTRCMQFVGAWPFLFCFAHLVYQFLLFLPFPPSDFLG